MYYGASGIEKQIIETAIENGATLAGVARVEALKSSPAHTIYTRLGSYTGVGTVKKSDASPGSQLFHWPDTARSVLVIALSHPKRRPELDWWDGRGTPGNRILIDIIERTARQLKNQLNIGTQKLHYYVEKGGIFLKDAAVLAGLGRIGMNNLLITPDYGPRIRLRALFLDADIDPTGPVDFDPCADCKVYCRKVCPENAMNEKAPLFESIGGSVDLPARDGGYDRERCNVRMEKDILKSKQKDSGGQAAVRYCRRCELVCPAGK